MRRPATTEVTLTFGYHAGYPLHNGVHQGVDFAYTPDAQIYAPAAGIVTVRPLNGDDGNAIYMTIGNQFHGFCHLQSFAVTDGQHVSEGQVLGIMGDTGAAEGRHLHWAVKVNGSFVDPLTLVDEQGEPMVNEGDIVNIYRVAIGRDPNANDLAAWVGKDWKSFVYDLIGRGDFAQQYKAQIAQLEKASAVNHDSVLQYVKDNLK